MLTKKSPAAQFRREKERHLAAIRHAVKLHRHYLNSKIRAHNGAVGFAVGPVGFAAICGLVGGYIASTWLLSTFWHPVRGVSEGIGVVTAALASRIPYYRTYRDKIYALLAAYTPVDEHAYRDLQKALRDNDQHLYDDVLCWIERERMALHASNPATSPAPRDAFLSMGTRPVLGEGQPGGNPADISIAGSVEKVGSRSQDDNPSYR